MPSLLHPRAHPEHEQRRPEVGVVAGVARGVGTPPVKAQRVAPRRGLALDLAPPTRGRLAREVTLALRAGRCCGEDEARGARARKCTRPRVKLAALGLSIVRVGAAEAEAPRLATDVAADAQAEAVYIGMHAASAAVSKSKLEFDHGSSP